MPYFLQTSPFDYKPARPHPTPQDRCCRLPWDFHFWRCYILWMFPVADPAGSVVYYCWIFVISHSCFLQLDSECLLSTTNAAPTHPLSDYHSYRCPVLTHNIYKHCLKKLKKLLINQHSTHGDNFLSGTQSGALFIWGQPPETGHIWSPYPKDTLSL